MLQLAIESCEFAAKEVYLGNILYLSEYDCEDRRILYQSEKQSVSGIEIAPMTVTEIGYDNEFIIVKSDDTNGKEVYWIIENTFDGTPKPEEVRENTSGPLNKVEFDEYIVKNKVKLRLKQIKC